MPPPFLNNGILDGGGGQGDVTPYPVLPVMCGLLISSSGMVAGGWLIVVPLSDVTAQPLDCSLLDHWPLACGRMKGVS